MKIISNPSTLKTKLTELKAELKHSHIHTHPHNTPTVALVPTMGNLHEGHLSLIHKAKQVADICVVSLFINPLQFAPHEDFDDYPRTLNNDLKKLKALEVDILFAPTEQVFFPHGRQQQTQVFVPNISNILCGTSRPVFFQGVATIVTKLFNCVQPNFAIFGEKDFQQLVMLKQLVKDLHFDINIIAMPIVREADGLAMSSRNQYLSKRERETAPALFTQLQETAAALSENTSSENTSDATMIMEQLIATAKTNLTNKRFKVDYYEIRTLDLKDVKKNKEINAINPINPEANIETLTNANNLIILAAVYLGKTRLIDNLQ